MRTTYLDIEEAWGVVICYDLEQRDEAEMCRLMASLGVYDCDEPLGVLLRHKNTGMCVTDMEKRMSLIFVGDATDSEQWWDTVTHELYHCQQAICEYYGVRSDSEDGAWTMGYLMRKTVEQIAPPCSS